MTNDMLFGGLMILAVVAGIVIAMTSSRPSGHGNFDTDRHSRRDLKDRHPRR